MKLSLLALLFDILIGFTNPLHCWSIIAGFSMKFNFKEGHVGIIPTRYSDRLIWMPNVSDVNSRLKCHLTWWYSLWSKETFCYRACIRLIQITIEVYYIGWSIRFEVQCRLISKGLTSILIEESLVYLVLLGGRKGLAINSVLNSFLVKGLTVIKGQKHHQTIITVKSYINTPPTMFNAVIAT